MFIGQILTLTRFVKSNEIKLGEKRFKMCTKLLKYDKHEGSYDK